jgi:Flp pilus assembly protein TadD
MGRTRVKTKRNERILGSYPVNVNTSESNQPPPSIPALYEKAESLVEQCDYELAAKFLRRILDIQTSHIQARELLGIVLIELGDIGSARQVSHIAMIMRSSINLTELFQVV